jgi:hypothetical protein
MPTPDDSRSLVIQRLKPAGVLVAPASEKGALPREYFVDGGIIRASAVGMASTGRNSALLQFADRYRRPVD